MLVNLQDPEAERAEVRMGSAAVAEAPPRAQGLRSSQRGRTVTVRATLEGGRSEGCRTPVVTVRATIEGPC